MIAHLLRFQVGEDASLVEIGASRHFLRSVHNFDIDLRQKISYNTDESYERRKKQWSI